MAHIDAYLKNREASLTMKNSNKGSSRLLRTKRGNRTFAQFPASPSRIGSATRCGSAFVTAPRFVKSRNWDREWQQAITVASCASGQK